MMEKSFDTQSVKQRQTTVDIENNIHLLRTAKLGKNRDVWFTFKFIEMIIGIICLVFHMKGTLYMIEPQPHTVYFCGTFVGFAFISLFSQIRMLLGTTTPPLLESMIAVFASFAYYFSAFASMYFVEKDFHLQYLSDHEESVHQFFVTSKYQSVSALICGSVYLLHAVYAIDSCMMHEETGKTSDLSSPTGPIELHLFFRPWLEKIKFFQHFYARIETLEAVAVWKRSIMPENDDNLGPGINIYAFEEPIILSKNEIIVDNKKSEEKTKAKSKSQIYDDMQTKRKISIFAEIEAKKRISEAKEEKEIKRQEIEAATIYTYDQHTQVNEEDLNKFVEDSRDTNKKEE